MKSGLGFVFKIPHLITEGETLVYWLGYGKN